jgi:uncharacterized membrane protein
MGRGIGMGARIVSVVTLVGTGIVTGVFFAVAVSVLPALFAMPAGRYVEAHRLLGKGYHPSMPLIVTAALLSDVALVALAPTGLTRALFGAAAVLLVGVQLVSQFRNVPINRALARVRADAIPPDWTDPRRSWRDWHLLRTALATLAMLSTSVAVVLVR